MKNKIVCIVGLGYVGLPLTMEFSKKMNVIGFDIDEERVEELQKGTDSSNEIDGRELKSSKVSFTSNEKEISKADYVIITVPTPLTNNNEPDLSLLKEASKIVGRNLKKNTVVIYESSVYPGVTEEVCKPILLEHSGLKNGEFKLGYSPERINPGDKVHCLSNIVKVVAAEDKETTSELEKLYEKIIKAGVYKAPNIKTAEAAKLTENIQRDVNIALMNELAMIFSKIGIDTKEVLDTAKTKWNFLNFYPGLVGGNCVPVNPYYLMHKAKEVGYNNGIVLAARNVNDSVAKQVAELTINALKDSGKELKKSKVLVMGLTFKENVKDYRGCLIRKIIMELKKEGVRVVAYDPILLGNKFAEEYFEVKNKKIEKFGKIDAIIFAVAHKQFKEIKLEELKKIAAKNPVLVDVKWLFSREAAKKNAFTYIRI